MKIITTKRKIVRKYRKVWDPIYKCYNRVDYQCLVEQTFIFGISFGYIMIDKEVIPDWAIFQVGCLGSTEWRSKFTNLEEVW